MGSGTAVRGALLVGALLGVLAGCSAEPVDHGPPAPNFGDPGGACPYVDKARIESTFGVTGTEEVRDLGYCKFQKFGGGQNFLFQVRVGSNEFGAYQHSAEQAVDEESIDDIGDEAFYFTDPGGKASYVNVLQGPTYISVYVGPSGDLDDVEGTLTELARGVAAQV